MCVVARAKALSAKENMVEDKPTAKRYEKNLDYKKKNNKFSRSYPHLQEEGKLLCRWKDRSSCTSVQT